MDLMGIGELGKAIPPAAWKRIVETACSTFENVLAPITETTGGLGRFIKARFDRLTEPEKVVVANTFATAHEKVERSGVRRNPSLDVALILKVTECSASQIDPNLRELWSNLLARELTEGSVHPEIANVLGRLTVEDVVRFLEIARTSKEENLKRLGVAVRTVIKLGSGLGVMVQMKRGRMTQQEFMLERLGLIEWENAAFELRNLGALFLQTVAPLVRENPQARN